MALRPGTDRLTGRNGNFRPLAVEDGGAFPSPWRAFSTAIFLSAFFLSAFASNPARAQEADDTRKRVDISAAPFAAVGQVNNAAYGRCTGVLIGPRKALTAAHCLYNARTDQFLHPGSVHFVLGYDRGAYAFATVLSKIEIPKAYDPADPITTIAYDVAVLHFDDAVPGTIQPLVVAPKALEPGTPLMAAGYARDRLYALTAVETCMAAGHIDAMSALIENCPILEGYSGGPLIDKEGRLIAIMAARGGGANDGIVLAVRPTSQFD